MTISQDLISQQLLYTCQRSPADVGALLPNSSPSSADIQAEKQQDNTSDSSIPLNTEGYFKGKGTLKKKGSATSIRHSTRELSLEISAQYLF